MRKLTASILSLSCGLASPCVAQVLYDNGGVTTTPNAACIPAGSFDSQLQVVATVANGYYGFGHMLTATNNNRIADDFVVPAPGWAITTIEFLDYQTNATPAGVSPINGMNVRIWNGPPNVATSQVIYGDVITNRLSGSVTTQTYRIGSTCDLRRELFKSTVTINVSLLPGTYWIDWQATGSPNFSGPWAPVVTITGQRNKPGSNAIQSLDGGQTWIPIIDDGPSPDFSSPPLPQDLPFVIRGSLAPACYANCDASTSIPVLTANDFQCFLNNYAAASPVANCDGSTSPPILTANDFQCFLNAYAAGCS